MSRSITCPENHQSVLKKNAIEVPLSRGTQIFTPLTLIRLTSENDQALTSIPDEVDDLAEMISESIQDSAPQLPVSQILDWKLSELKRAVAEETDILERVIFHEGLYQCSACMDEVIGSSLGYSCSTLGCHGALCLDCFVQLAYVIISSAMYAVPVLRCPGGCMCRIPTKVWRGVLKTQKATPPILAMVGSADSDAESILYTKYCENAEALMKMRCGCCHTTNELFISELNGDAILTSIDDRLNTIDQIISCLSPGEQLIFYRTWLLFNRGRLPTDAFITTMYDLFSEKMLSQDDIQSITYSGLYQPLNLVMAPILSLLCDVERRLCAQLGLFRKYPKIVTRCCYEPHCFMCKVYGHHEDITCEQMQEQEIGIDAQFCPACGVPTLRTEGCSHIVCVCWMDWEWQEF